MTQPSILDYRFPQSSLLFPTRASPFVCVTDSLEILTHLSYELQKRTPLNIAAWKICQRRRHDRYNPLITSNDLGESVIRLHPKASAILFLATLTQAVKVFGFQGVGWAKIFVAIYLLSYLIQAGIEVLATSPHQTNPPTEEEGELFPAYNAHYVKTKSYIAVFSLFGSFVFCSWAIHAVCISDFRDLDPNRKFSRFNGDLRKWSHLYGNSFLGWFLFVCDKIGFTLRLVTMLVLIFYPIISILRLPMLYSDDITNLYRTLEEMDIRWWLVWISLLLFVPVTIGLFGIFIILMTDYWWFSDFEYLIWFTDGAGVLLFVLGSIWMAVWMVRLACDRWTKNMFLGTWRVRFQSPFFLVLSSIMHLVVACLYFAFAYDPTGTVKPAWTEQLG